MIRIPHFSLPFRIVNGAAAVTDQDTVDEITDCVQAVIRYPTGYRIELPEFGIVDPAFEQGGADVAGIRAALTRWEPRADALVEADADKLAELVAQVTVEVNGGNR